MIETEVTGRYVQYTYWVVSSFWDLYGPFHSNQLSFLRYPSPQRVLESLLLWLSFVAPPLTPSVSPYFIIEDGHTLLLLRSHASNIQTTPPQLFAHAQTFNTSIFSDFKGLGQGLSQRVSQGARVKMATYVNSAREVRLQTVIVCVCNMPKWTCCFL